MYNPNLYSGFFTVPGGDQRNRSAVVCLPERLSEKERDLISEEIRSLVEISGIEPLLFVCLKDSQDTRKTPENLTFSGVGGDKRDRTAVVFLPERLSEKERDLISEEIRSLVEISGIEPLTS